MQTEQSVQSPLRQPRHNTSMTTTEISTSFASQASELGRLVEESRRIVTLCHMSPDGDAVGSSLAFASMARRMGKMVNVITPDAPQKSLMCLPHAKEIVVGSHKPELARRLIAEADLIMMFDFNTLSRIDRLAEAVAQARGRKAVVDHHAWPDIEADLVVSAPHRSSTCELLYELVEANGMLNHLDSEGASCLYCGMMTDTGNFSYNSNNPRLYHIVADLIGRGVDKDSIYKKVWNVSSASRLRLCGYAISMKMETLGHLHGALIHLTHGELERFGYVRGDTEGLVNEPLAIPGVVWSAFLREDAPDYVKVSMRSQGDFAVNTICADHFSGGGHANAAGGELHCSISEAVAKVKEVMEGYSSHLPQGLPNIIDNFQP